MWWFGGWEWLDWVAENAIVVLYAGDRGISMGIIITVLAEQSFRMQFWKANHSPEPSDEALTWATEENSIMQRLR